jgi:hypothetical protein
VTAPFGEGINTSDQPWSIANWYVQGGDGSVSGLSARTQGNVTNVLKSNVKGSPGWKLSTDAVYDGLRTGIGLPLAIIEAVINQFLAPFGLDDEFSDLIDALNEAAQAFMDPWGTLTNLAEQIEDTFNDAWARIAGLEARVNALQLSLDPDITETGGYDNCKTDANFTNVVGNLLATGWGALTADQISVGLYESSPATDRHGAGMKVKVKMPGTTRLHICADSAMTNWVGLQLHSEFLGHDTASVITGTGPTTGVITRTSRVMDIPENSFWEIRYEPFDDESPTSNTFHVYRNGDEVVGLRWRDDGNIVIHGPDHLRVGITLNGSNNLLFRGLTVTDFTYYDWLAASPL